MNYSKDGITVAPIIDTSHPKKNGKCPVKIRVTYRRDRRYYPTGKDLTLDEWEGLTTTKVRALVAVRKDIESSYQIVRGVVEELARDGIFSFDSLNKRLKRSGVDTLNRAFAAKIAELKEQDLTGSPIFMSFISFIFTTGGRCRHASGLRSVYSRPNGFIRRGSRAAVHNLQRAELS